MDELEDGWLAEELKSVEDDADAWIINAEAQYAELASLEQKSK